VFAATSDSVARKNIVKTKERSDKLKKEVETNKKVN